MIRRSAAWVVFAAALAVCAGSYLHALAPGSAAAPLFGSDAAVPVLMGNDPRFDLFHAYYFGQDRFGAWPFLAASALGRLLRFAWTPASLHALQTLWLFSGVVPAALLGGKRPATGGLAWLAALGLPGEVRGQVSDLGQPYAWQLAALLWAWWGCRRWTERGGAGRGISAFLPAVLAVWTSTLSLPLLAGLAAIEAVRARTRPFLRGLGRALLPAAVAGAAELALRVAYHAFALARYGHPYVTRIHLDVGHLEANFLAVTRRLLAPDAWPVLLLAASLLAAGTWRGARVAGGPERRDLVALALGLFALAVLPIPVLVLVNHVRANGYNNRYFTPTLAFASGAVWAGGALAATRIGCSRLRGAAEALAAAALALALFWTRPRWAPDPRFERLSRTAAALAARAPGSPLVNGYWGSYVFTALLAPGKLVSIPAEGDYLRTPFDLAALRRAKTVVLGEAGPLAAYDGKPPPRIIEYGVELRLVLPELYRDGSEAFALYANATEARATSRLPVTR